MKIKIIKAGSPGYWYSLHIGKEFEVLGETEKDYRVLDGNHFVAKSDCEIIKDEISVGGSKTFVKEGDKLVCISDKYEDEGLYQRDVYEVNYAEDDSFTVKKSSGIWTNPIESFNVFKMYEELKKETYVKVGDKVKCISEFKNLKVFKNHVYKVTKSNHNSFQNILSMKYQN